ncbi:MAG: hypothetical protein IT165_25500 [Bryobacterales bacterium]|nr:hypothetical protein [Bryobacterales bacterium]
MLQATATLEQRPVAGHTAGELESAVRLLKERLSAGLPMDLAMVQAGEATDAAYQRAAELWFGMEF